MRGQSIVRMVALVAALPALPACASEGAAQSADALIGTHWALRNVAQDRAGSVSAASNTWLEVTSSYQVFGRDGCSVFQADSHRIRGTLTIANVVMAGNGCLSDHGTLDATRVAVDAMLAGPPVQLRVSPSDIGRIGKGPQRRRCRGSARLSLAVGQRARVRGRRA
jgi:hypothetical protein